MPYRTIIHLDMNAFFASVEQQANPALRGKPIAVVGRGSRTVVTTASYEARAFGVKTGMNRFEAQRQCPHIIFVEGNNRLYAETCEGFTAICRAFTPMVEVFSIDEVFMDVTGSLKLFGTARYIVDSIKQQIKNRYGLTCSAGIAPNKLLAKIASDLKKPDGLVEIQPAEVPAFMENLPAGAICGIGKKTQAKLALLGITTCGQLGRADGALLRRQFGVPGGQLVQMGRGEDDSPVIPVEQADDPKSIGHSHTLPQDVTSRDMLETELLRLSEKTGRRLREACCAGRTVCVTIRYQDFTTFSRRATFARTICETQDIFNAAKAILAGIKLQQPVRLIGVSVSGLDRKTRQPSLFDAAGKGRELSRAMDAINDRFGECTLTWGKLLESSEEDGHGGVIAPSWRPEGTRKIKF
jgi:DNA polymerase-4